MLCLILVILLLSLLKGLFIFTLMMTLANMKQFICCEVYMCLMIVNIYKKCISKKSISKIESETVILTIYSKGKKDTKGVLINEKKLEGFGYIWF